MAKQKKTNPLWLRSWRRRNGTYHVEVRDPKGGLVVLDTYHGEDHTLHIILGKD